MSKNIFSARNFWISPKLKGIPELINIINIIYKTIFKSLKSMGLAKVFQT